MFVVCGKIYKHLKELGRKMKNKIKVKELIKKYYRNVIILVVGVSFMALGGAMLVSANYGSDALMVFNQGVATFLNIKVGIAIMITNLLVLIVIIFVNRKSIGLGTIAIAFLLGPLVDMILQANILPTPITFWGSALTLALAFLAGTFGISLYMFANVGLSPFEGILIAIKEKKNWRFAYIKIVNDAFFFTIGWLLGGVFGIASIITVFIYGPLIDFFTKLFTKMNLFKLPKSQEKVLPEAEKNG
jgi:uncharacterized membrane protein YczE